MPVKKRVNAAEAVQGKRPKLGQNFLADARAAERIVEALGDVSQKTVVEIGPGRGVLTKLLAERSPRVIAIELDRVLGAQLRFQFTKNATVEIVEADVLAVDFGRLVGRTAGTGGDIHPMNAPRARVIGNLPYYITSPILTHLFRYHASFETIVIMVQREVAERIAAKPGGSEYGLLSATTQLYAKVEKLFTLPPGAFAPPPKVHSTVLRLTVAPRFEKLGVPEAEFIRYLEHSFAQKRKTLLNNLKQDYPQEQIQRALAAAKLRPDVRAEAAPLEKQAEVFKHLKTYHRDTETPR